MERSSALPYLTVPALDRIPWLIHGFGTRAWTLAGFRKTAGWKDFEIVWLKQIHTDRIHVIEEAPRGRLRGDALVTARPGIFLIMKTADCLPVFLVDPTQRVIAAVHCGWRGTRLRILERTVEEMRLRCGCRPSSLLAALGPCIAAPCYEVGEDVREAFREENAAGDDFRRIAGRAGKYHFDLRAANRRQLIGAGIGARRVFDAAACTHCDPRLHSFRRDRDTAARLYNFIGMSG